MRNLDEQISMERSKLADLFERNPESALMDDRQIDRMMRPRDVRELVAKDGLDKDEVQGLIDHLEKEENEDSDLGDAMSLVKEDRKGNLENEEETDSGIAMEMVTAEQCVWDKNTN